MFFYQTMVEGLGCYSYMIGSQQTGECVVVDPQRDVERYLEIAHANRLTITRVIETHVHADHVSGCRALAAYTGAAICLHERAGVRYPHTALCDGDTLTLGECCITVLFTPGHTPDSICLHVQDCTPGAEAVFVLTGDTLMVGDVGRPDLVQAQAAGDMAARLYHSLHEQLLCLPDDTRLYPGHGAGSLCARNLRAGNFTTIGQERCSNPALQAPTLEAFVEAVATNLPQQPANFRYIKSLNTQGTAQIECGGPRPLAPSQAARLLSQGHVLVDTRSLVDFSMAHMGGAVNLPLDDAQFASRAGYLLTPGAAVVLICDDTPDALERQCDRAKRAAECLARVGYDRVAGYIEGGVQACQRAGLPLATVALRQANPCEIAMLIYDEQSSGAQLVDVRELWEWNQGHLPGAIHIPLAQLEQRAHEIERGRAVVAYCRGGTRSQIAAAILAQMGHRQIYNMVGGIESWRKAGYPVASAAPIASAFSG